jgi:hypothetical protein
MIVVKDINLKLDNDNGGKGRTFTAKFIEPTLTGYGEEGVLNVTLEALMRFYQTMIGCPVVIKHQEVTDDNAREVSVGYVTSAEYGNDGWFYCSGILYDKKALELIGKGWSVSCTYEVLETTGMSGERNAVPFDDELVNGKFLQLAIVPNPRYEKATITLMNSKEKGEKMWKNIFNSKKLKNSEEKEKEMAKKNEADTDKNALKNKIMEMINGAIKGDKKVDGENEDSWYKELREMLDKLAYTESEDKKSNSDDEEDKKDNKCNSEDSDEDKEEKENSEDDSDKSDKSEEDDKDEKDNSEDKDEKDDSDKDEKSNESEEDKKDVKENSKDLKRLHNSGLAKIETGYESEKSRLALGNKLF